ncbi:SAS053 family DNA gyrase inhibitor [Staphylococcus americanisciuri]|uniref:SAS053 family protein n=1 Tax=Staphylococcus americanisciuri TaxID=2973940 RepID=A0ABT2F4N1_9STAP|nr:SAS053 family protein [Staphylococcus americanisciuri]MCS4487138.1 SAS053 family protein [Staphylococcus americanisciuri]
MNKQNSDNGMVESFEEVVELGKEMEQISEENDEQKYDQSHEESVRSDRKSGK